MLQFVNAKINIGLQIVNRRANGYHDLQTVFYPVGVYAGTPQNPVEFCDILEVVPAGPKEHEGSLSPRELIELELSGRKVDCSMENNLVWRAATLFMERCVARGYEPQRAVRVLLEKHLPDGAGMGGGSADASFTLRLLADLVAEETQGAIRFTDEELCDISLALGADCPFFILNRPVYAEGVGERMQEIALDLGGKWLVVVKPAVSVSTREAFVGITPRPATFDLRELATLPIEEWRGVVHNDFEDSLFPRYPELADIKRRLYSYGAVYASLTGSGSCVYGIFTDREDAADAAELFPVSTTISARYLLKL